jgi:LacI family transcriptional regulator
MSISTVAQIAGVSPSTVSRVLNERPNVAASTVENVRRVMRELSFSPIIRRRGAMLPSTRDSLKTATIAFMVFGTCGSRPTPAFELLLRGVSDQASKTNLNLIFSFVSDPAQLPPRIAQRRVDGLLVHGERPGPEVQAHLQSLPTVWLMGNPQRPVWGDQVMPDNAAIGEMAAKYLLGRGHRRLAYLGTAASWSLEIRSLAFAHAAREAGAQVEIIEATEQRGDDFWQRDDLSNATRTLAERLAQSRNHPTGIFIAEDRLVPLVEAAMRMDPSSKRVDHNGNGNGHANGDRNGNGDGHANGDGNGKHSAGQHGASSLDIISCNNERSHFAGLTVSPATIDIRADVIGRLAVERLIWRLRRPDLPERIRCMVEPALVEPEF